MVSFEELITMVEPSARQSKGTYSGTATNGAGRVSCDDWPPGYPCVIGGNSKYLKNLYLYTYIYL